MKLHNTTVYTVEEKTQETQCDAVQKDFNATFDSESGILKRKLGHHFRSRRLRKPSVYLELFCRAETERDICVSAPILRVTNGHGTHCPVLGLESRQQVACPEAVCGAEKERETCAEPGVAPA
jgi:hypothetical protein